MPPSVKVIVINLTILFTLYDTTTSLIIPEEVPTILAVIYSNIPPIKKGTDSRVGVGFRLGEHADVQIVLELGPQKETGAIGNVDTVRRREAMLSAAMKGEFGPWAQAIAKYQNEQRIKKELENIKKFEEKLKQINHGGEKNQPTDNKNKDESSDWLEKWSKEVKESPQTQVPLEERVPNNKIVLNVVNSPTLPNDS